MNLSMGLATVRLAVVNPRRRFDMLGKRVIRSSVNRVLLAMAFLKIERKYSIYIFLVFRFPVSDPDFLENRSF